MKRSWWWVREEEERELCDVGWYKQSLLRKKVLWEMELQWQIRKITEKASERACLHSDVPEAWKLSAYFLVCLEFQRFLILHL